MYTYFVRLIVEIYARKLSDSLLIQIQKEMCILQIKHLPFGGVRSMSFFLHHPLGKMNFDLEWHENLIG